MNYAWAHPINGTREQAETLEEARFRLWTELQSEGSGQSSAAIFEQERIGWVERSQFYIDDPEPWESYAWASPFDGKRMISYAKEANAAATVAQVSFKLVASDSPADQVALYRQRAAAIIYRSDPRPVEPRPPDPVLDTPKSLLYQILSGETEVDLQRAQVLALLWIAENKRHRRRESRIISVRPRPRRIICYCGICRFRRWLGELLPWLPVYRDDMDEEPPLFKERNRPAESDETSQEEPPSDPKQYTHQFKGRTDRWCEICNLPDRHCVHSEASLKNRPHVFMWASANENNCHICGKAIEDAIHGHSGG